MRVPITARSAYRCALRDMKHVKERAQMLHALPHVTYDETHQLIMDMMQAKLQIKLAREAVKAQKNA